MLTTSAPLMSLRSAFARLSPRAQARTWVAGCGAAVILVGGLWLSFWVYTLPLELVWLIALPLRVARLQRAKQHLPLAMRSRCTPAEREQSLARVLAAIKDAHQEGGLARFLSAWHLGTPAGNIRRGDLQRFLCGMVFYVESPDELMPSERLELEEMVLAVEAAYQPCEEGEPQANLRAMRVCLPSEPLRWMHFPLGVYLCLAGLQVVSHAVLWLAGFQRHTAGVVSYYHRPAAAPASPSRPPLVLLPGIGIGVGAYIPLLASLLSRSDVAQSDVFAVEFAHVTAGRLQGGVPEEEKVVASILAMLRAHAPAAAAQSPSSARFVAHSYGTFAIAWLLRDPASRGAVHSALLLDPVAVLISFPHTTHGAVYRRVLELPLSEALAAAAAAAAAAGTEAPEGATGALQSRLAAAASSARLLSRLALTFGFTREAHIALVLQRHIHWPSYSLWLEDAPLGCHITLALSSRDALVPSQEVANYAEAVAQARRDLRVQVLWLQQHEHGEVAWNSAHWGELAQALAQ